MELLAFSATRARMFPMKEKLIAIELDLKKKRLNEKNFIIIEK